MPSRCCVTFAILTPTPFLYPSLWRSTSILSRKFTTTCSRSAPTDHINNLPESHLNPPPDDYSSPTFTDKAELTLYAGKGGNGCISFLREAYLPEGPANGGDGGSGGHIWIQAAHGETSLHKLARKRFIRAGRGKHGQGSARGGSRGEDVVITVPVGTIVRELEREDPAAEDAENIRMWNLMKKQQRKEERLREEEQARLRKAMQQNGVADPLNDEVAEEDEDDIERRTSLEKEEEMDELDKQDPSRGKWLLYPGLSKSDMRSASFPKLPTRTRYFQQPAGPMYLDLSRPSPKPILLATGGIGGLGNPHFTSMKHPRPMFATKGEDAVTMKIELELKLLADVGLVGLPNAGKSTLLRALTNSRTRVGNWAFTTLQPNIGTVVLDKYSGRPNVTPVRPSSSSDSAIETETDPRTRFTVADIPGLVEGAHLDYGLGISFLRHVERAGVLAFVIDLSAGDAVRALDALWQEVSLYARMREEEESERNVDSRVDWDMSTHDSSRGPINLMDESILGTGKGTPEANAQIAGKPWFVVATKADLRGTQTNYKELKEYLESISEGETKHPSGVEGGWTKNVTAIPVSAINNQGVDRIVHWTVGLLCD